MVMAVEPHDPVVGLPPVGALRRLAERLEARQRGSSSEEFGGALGVARQSVHHRYGRDARGA